MVDHSRSKDKDNHGLSQVALLALESLPAETKELWSPARLHLSGAERRPKWVSYESYFLISKRKSQRERLQLAKLRPFMRALSSIFM